MTEFLIFLLLCSLFAFGFWRFLSADKRANRKRGGRIRDQVASEMTDLRAKVRADDIAARARQPAEPLAFVASNQAGTTRFGFLKNRVEDYDGPFPEQPFGYDIEKAQNRLIPQSYHGRWISQRLVGQSDVRHASYRSIIEVTATELIVSGEHQPVAAVLTGEENQLAESVEPEIAVVSEHIEENGKWLFSLAYFGLIDGGGTLIDLESMDTKWVRADHDC